MAALGDVLSSHLHDISRLSVEICAGGVQRHSGRGFHHLRDVTAHFPSILLAAVPGLSERSAAQRTPQMGRSIADKHPSARHRLNVAARTFCTGNAGADILSASGAVGTMTPIN